MKVSQSLLVSVALGVPSTVSAHAAQEPGRAPTETAPPRAADAETTAAIKGYVLAVVAGIQSGESATAALYELAGTEPFERSDARKTAELADDAVEMARERAGELRKMKGLPDEVQAHADAAAQKLKEAHATVEGIQRKVGLIKGAFGNDEAQQVRDESVRLHTQLGEARKAIQQVADAYRISTRLQIPEKAAMQERD